MHAERCSVPKLFAKYKPARVVRWKRPHPGAVGFTAAMARAAATYFVLGKADDENFAKAEHLAETLMSALPSGVMPTSSTTLPTCPAGLTQGVFPWQ